MFFISALFVTYSFQFCACEGSLISAVVVFTPGSKTPDKFYKTDPYQNANFWSSNPGHLTNEGKFQAMKLGFWLQQRYRNLIKDSYIISMNENDTKATANCVQSGARQDLNYVNSRTTAFQGSVDTQRELCKLPKGTLVYTDDDLLTPQKELIQMQKNLLDNYLNQLLDDPKSRMMLEYISEHSGEQIRNFTQLYQLEQTLKIETEAGLDLPPWTSKIYPQPLKYLSNLYLTSFSQTQQMKRLAAGSILTRVAQFFSGVFHRREAKKMLMISLDDLRLISLLNTLKLYNYEELSYCSALVFELSENEGGEREVNFFYTFDEDINRVRRETTETKTPKISRNEFPHCRDECRDDECCQEKCSLDEFLDRVACVLTSKYH